jgi:hypothetical protein
MTHFYDIHSLIGITSDVALPELAAFAVTAEREPVTIRVRSRGFRREKSAARNAGTLIYDEGLGPFGFAVKISLENPIEIDASPLLRHSPHVLYTNVVEPVLRWRLVEKGWALIHGACVSRGGDAYVVTARTDTGKTTTVLTLLRHYPKLSFLADDLCLLRADGRLLAYPKPMTISRHTLSAINPRALSAIERAKLVVQSRVHSRSGRRFAQFLARTGLPVATINTLVQWLVPPPKYSIQRLLPHAALAEGASVRGLFLIERGECDEVLELEPETAVEMLAANCEDAFGFPPYPLLEGGLRHQGGRDLREREREIIASAFADLRATLLRSRRFGWWRGIATSIDRPTVRPAPVMAAVASAR